MAANQEQVLTWLRQSADVLREQRTYLTELDAAIGDADHGINMDRGFTAVMEKLANIGDADAAAILK
ncbi:MAG: DAK2 domain-containing protein, partial [Ktedonobacterales bacterium]